MKDITKVPDIKVVEVYKNMNIKSIITLLVVISMVTVTSAAVIYEYNNTATAEVTIEKPNSEDIQTLVSSDGVNFYESITLDNISTGDTFELTFSHENVGDSDFVFGTVNYLVSCEEGLEFEGPCEGSIHDFYDSEPGLSILPYPNPVSECTPIEYGIVHKNTWGDSYCVNTLEFVEQISKESAAILPNDYGVFENTEYSGLTLTFVHGAHGTYTVDGTVVTIELFEIPATVREQINESIIIED